MRLPTFGRWVAFIGASLAIACGTLGSLGRDAAEYTAAVGIEVAGRIDCGAYCNGTWYHAGYCFTNQTCCGWVNCANGNSQLTCCNANQTCQNGLQADPPSQPQCVANP